MVGYNRRFSPMCVELKNRFLSGHPIAIQYRINSGFIPSIDWVHDIEIGGGRIIERCATLLT